MKVGIVGSGYVGLVTGACLAETGNDVVCQDIDEKKIELLTKGKAPFYEPELEPLIVKNLSEERLRFTTEVSTLAQQRIIFFCVGTPSDTKGDADLSALYAAVDGVLASADGPRILVLKSTVPVGTAERIRARIKEQSKHPHLVVSNPEFLKQGAAVSDFMKPDRVVIGTQEEEAGDEVESIYKPFVRTGRPILRMDHRSAELMKYAANALLATRITFMNQLANLCDKVGADIEMLRLAIGTDVRIGPAFLFAGVGWGGSCLLGEETVLTRHTGRTALIRLEQLWAEPLHGVGDEVATWDPQTGQAGWFRIEEATQRQFEGRLYTICTKMGRRVKLTEDHPLVTRWRGVQLARDLTVDDWLPLLPEGLPNEKPLPFRLLDGASFHPESVILRLPATVLDPLAKKLRCVLTRPRFSDVMRGGTLRLSEALQVGLNVAQPGITASTARSSTYAPTLIPNDARFWYIAGLYAAEGWISTDRGRYNATRIRTAWAFHPTDEEDLVEAVVRYWRSLGVEPRVYHPKTSTTVSISSRILGEWLFRTLKAGKDGYDARVPDSLWNSPKEHQVAFLAGFWRGDGSWKYTQNRRGVVLTAGTASRDLADGVVRLLQNIGIVASVSIRRVNKSTVDTYFIDISGAEQIERVIELVKPCYLNEVRAAIVKQTKRIAPTGYRVDERGTPWVRVRSIEAQPFSGPVYSIEVKGASTFATTMGLVVHNCFGKDMKALSYLGREVGAPTTLVEEALASNAKQPLVVIEKLKKSVGDLSGKVIAFWGLSFKPSTDDVRDAPSLLIAKELLQSGATLQVYDPKATENFLRNLGTTDGVTSYLNAYEALRGADALVLLTEWSAFRNPDFTRIKKLLRNPVIIDGRNQYEPAEIKKLGFIYQGIGRREG